MSSIPLTLLRCGLSILIGWLVGGLANWAADTLPYRGRGVPSAGPAGYPTHIWHYLTLEWYIPRKGMCPQCGVRRPVRAPLLELAVIAVFAGLQYRWGFHLSTLLVSWCYAAFLLLVLMIDLEHRRVLNVMLLPASVLALMYSFLPGTPTPLSALMGGVLGFGLFLLLALISRGKLGAGDVKLAGVIGLMLGWEAVLPALCAGMILGGLTALFLLITRRATRKSYMAYAPYLSLGALAMLFLAR